jgi:GNAT superfamily N-acetyltransferase
MVTVRRANADDVDGCLGIVAGLPDYFTSAVGETVRADLIRHRGWVACADDGSDRLIGFAVIDQRGRAAEVLWIAIDAAQRGRGIGTTLLDRLLADLAAAGVQLVEAKTLDQTTDYAPYEATRAFWERHGFVQVDSIDPLPGWMPGNPAAIYIAALTSTRTQHSH